MGLRTRRVAAARPGLPKTRSGKIMRRILRKIASNEEDSLGVRLLQHTTYMKAVYMDTAGVTGGTSWPLKWPV
jgi:hypothetical protein